MAEFDPQTSKRRSATLTTINTQMTDFESSSPMRCYGISRPMADATALPVRIRPRKGAPNGILWKAASEDSNPTLSATVFIQRTESTVIFQ